MKLALLQHAQELRLRRRVQVSDLVQKQRSAIGQFEFSAACRCRAGKRTLFVAEQLAFNQFSGNRSAVDLYERAARKRALGVNVRGQKLLAGARFSGQEHARVAPGRHRRLLQHPLERSASSDHPSPAHHLA